MEIQGGMNYLNLSQNKGQHTMKEQLKNSNSEEPHPQFYPIDIELQFQQEYPIRLYNCRLSLADEAISSSNRHHSISSPDCVHILITSQCLNTSQSLNLSQQQTGSSTLISNGNAQNNNNRKQNVSAILSLSIPVQNILCIGKKSKAATLIMVKDKQTIIERDQDGYQIVSDSQDQQQFQQKKNELYEKIKLRISNIESLAKINDNPSQAHQLKQQKNTQKNQQQEIKLPIKQQQDNISINRVIQISRKCNLLLKMKNNQTFQKQEALYKYLSSCLQQFETNYSQQSNHIKNNPSFDYQSMVGNFNHQSINGPFVLMQSQQNDQELGMENQDYYQQDIQQNDFEQQEKQDLDQDEEFNDDEDLGSE